MKYKRILCLILILFFSVCILKEDSFLSKVSADDHKIVRVGWHEPPHYIKDENGRKSGYSYEYQMRIAAYTGWEYEYVEGTWGDLFEMLCNGEIDILSDVSYTDERAEILGYPSIPMGTEVYYLFVPPDSDIAVDNLSALNGKKVGLTKDSIARDFFEEWAEEYNIEAEIVEINCLEEEGLQYLGNTIDAYITMDTYGSPEVAVPVCKIGSSDFYFAVNKDRVDLLADLDSALNRIQAESRYYDEELHDKYLKSSENLKYLDNVEKDWLNNHGTIHVGYLDNMLAYCAKDKNGELTGTLKDYLEYTSTVFHNQNINYDTVAFDTSAEAIEALKNGKVDCIFPANLTNYDAEENGLVMTPPVMRTEMTLIVRDSEHKEFLQKDTVRIAVNEGNTNYDYFLADNYPNWEKIYFKDISDCINAVADKKADCFIISNYRYGTFARLCEKLGLETINTGIGLDYCFAVRLGDGALYSILAKTTNAIPDSLIYSSLTYYSTEVSKVSFTDYLKEYMFIITSVIALILLIIVILLWKDFRAGKKIKKERSLIKDLNRRVFVDSLTSVRNKGAYTEYIESLQKQMDNGELSEFAVGVFDCNNLKQVNDENGHDKGDIYLKNSCVLICKIFEHSPVFRIGGDEFAVILQNNDYINRNELINTFKEKQLKIYTETDNKWEKISVAFGIADYNPETDKSVNDVVRRADMVMYDNKRLQKEGKRI